MTPTLAATQRSDVSSEAAAGTSTVTYALMALVAVLMAIIASLLKK